MGCREFQTDPAELSRQGEKIAATQKSGIKYKIRVMAAIMVVSVRNAAAQAARTAGVSRATVSERARTAGQGGLEALKCKKREGRKPKLSIWQRLAPYFILQASPKLHGYDSGSLANSGKII